MQKMTEQQARGSRAYDTDLCLDDAHAYARMPLAGRPLHGPGRVCSKV
jgi:hypothetical protein